MKLEALDHPKTMDLAARLDAELPTVIGYLELLWAFTGKKAPQGNIGKWPDGAIARACYWMGRPEQFTQALVAAGFLDESTDHRLTVHDWHEHAPRWVKSKLSSLKAGFVTGVSDDAGPDIDEDASPDISPPSKGREGKTSEVKEGAQARATPGLNLDSWEAWLIYRKSIGKPVKPASLVEAAKKLASFGKDQDAVIRQSKANGWQGLFALKDAPRGTPGRPSALTDEWPELRARATAINFREPREGESPQAYQTLLKRAEFDAAESAKGSKPLRAAMDSLLSERRA